MDIINTEYYSEKGFIYRKVTFETGATSTAIYKAEISLYIEGPALLQTSTSGTYQLKCLDVDNNILTELTTQARIRIDDDPEQEYTIQVTQGIGEFTFSADTPGEYTINAALYTHNTNVEFKEVVVT